MSSPVWHDYHVRKAKKSKSDGTRSTEWQVGQPLAFPTSETFERAAREALEEGLRGPLAAKRPKRKKK